MGSSGWTAKAWNNGRRACGTDFFTPMASWLAPRTILCLAARPKAFSGALFANGLP